MRDQTQAPTILPEAALRGVSHAIRKVARNGEKRGLISIGPAPWATKKTIKTKRLQEMAPRPLDAKTAWVKLFIREASKGGYTSEDIVTLLDEPRMTVKEA